MNIIAFILMVLKVVAVSIAFMAGLSIVATICYMIYLYRIVKNLDYKGILDHIRSLKRKNDDEIQ